VYVAQGSILPSAPVYEAYMKPFEIPLFDE
jgi:hypothetical protein